MAASFEGIYSLDEHTENVEACEPGGDELPGADEFVLVMYQPVFGAPNVELVSCASVAGCRETLDARDAGHGFASDFFYSLSRRADDGALVGTTVSTGVGSGGTCREGEVGNNRLERVEDELRFTQERTVADDYPADGDGFCTTELAQQAAAGNPCSRFNQLSATFLEPL